MLKAVIILCVSAVLFSAHSDQSFKKGFSVSSFEIKDKGKSVLSSSQDKGNEQKDLSLEDADAKQELFHKSAPKVYLIEKLDYLNQILPEDYLGKTALNLRLAHVLSLSAEEAFTKSKEKKCQICLKKAKGYAKRSLAVYKELDPILLKNNHAVLYTEALFQQAYLERLLGNTKQSLLHLEKMTQENRIEIPLSLLVRAWYNIGEIQFELYSYDKALQAFNKFLKYFDQKTCFHSSVAHLPIIADFVPEAATASNAIKGIQKNLSQQIKNLCVEMSFWTLKASYYRIWSLFNLSFYEQALTRLLHLMSSDLYISSSLDKEEQNLIQKLEKEILTLYSYAPLTNQNLEFLYNFSKKELSENTLVKRQERLFILANRLQKIGRLKESNQVWEVYLSKTNSPVQQLTAYFFILSNDLTLDYRNRLNEIGSKVEKLLDLQKTVSLQKNSIPDKKLINLKIKEFFQQIAKKTNDLNLKQKKYLLGLHQNYNELNPENTDVMLLSALLAEDLKKYELAGVSLQTIVLNYKDAANSSQLGLKEKFCVKQMEMAELSQNKINRLKAYEFYIQHGSSAVLKYKAKYQTAYLYYLDKDFKRSQALFLKLTVNEFSPDNPSLRELYLKSAHLYLSSLKEEGDREKDLITYAGLFKERFSKNKREFINIYNLGILNYVEKLVGKKDFSRRPFAASQDPSVLKAWGFLISFDVKSADKKQLEAYYLNRLLLAKELLMFEDMDKSLKFLLSNVISETSREVALTWRIWLAELSFDFKEVLTALKLLKPKDQSEEYLLRLARVAEFAGENPVFYYQNFIDKFPESSFAHFALVSLIKLAEEEKKKEFLKKYAFVFNDKLEDLLYWILKIDNGEMDTDFMSFFIQNNLMREDSFLTVFLRRKESLDSFQRGLSLIESFSLPKKLSPAQTDKKVKKYMALLSQLEKKAVLLLKTKDWTIQTFIAAGWSRELKRFYNSILSLPLLEGLTQEEQKEYKKLLVKRMKAYLGQADQLEKELKILISPDFLADYKKALENPVFHPYLSWELSQLYQVLKGENQRQVQALITSIEGRSVVKRINVKALENEMQILYQKLRFNPFDLDSLNKMLRLEKKRNNTAKVSYLADRIEKIKIEKAKQNEKERKLDL